MRKCMDMPSLYYGRETSESAAARQFGIQEIATFRSVVADFFVNSPGTNVATQVGVGATIGRHGRRRHDAAGASARHAAHVRRLPAVSRRWAAPRAHRWGTLRDTE